MNREETGLIVPRYRRDVSSRDWRTSWVCRLDLLYSPGRDCSPTDDTQRNPNL